MLKSTDKILTMLKSIPGNLVHGSVAFFLSQILIHYILGIASVITFGINTSQISSIYSAITDFIVTN